MEKILTDTCIFIDIFRGNEDLYKYLIHLDIVISSITYMELIQGAKNKTELDKIDQFLNHFNIIQIDQSISKKSIELLKMYSKGYGLLIPDALIAATAIVKNCPLWTLNLKDFKFINALTLFDSNQ